jgi:PAS domain S-box-containing protein
MSHEGKKMKDQNKTKKQLINELTALHQRVDELEALEKEHRQKEGAPRESEEQLRLITDSLPVLISYVDSEQRYRFNNRAYERWFGCLREEVYGKHIKEVLGEAAYEVIRPYVEVALSGQEVGFENWVPYKDGGNRYVGATYVPHFGEQRQVKGFFTLVDDLTEHKRKDEELERYEQSLEKLVEERTTELRMTVEELQREINDRKRAEGALLFMRFSVDNAVDTMVCVDHDARFIDVNDAFCRRVGYSREELLSMSVHDIDPDYPTETWPEFWEKLKQSGSLTFESCHRTKEGKVFPVEITANFLEYKGKEYHCSFVRDITERKRAEETLRESKEFAENLIASMQDGFSVLDGHGVHIDVNSAFCQMTGFLREELIGVGPPHLYWPPEAYEEIERVFQKTLQGEFSQFELTFMRKNGERFPVIVSPSWIKDNQGNVISYFSTVKDITGRKRMEDLLRTERDLGLALSATAGLDETLSLCFDAAIRVSEMDCGGIYLVDEISGNLDLVFQKGLSAGFVKSVLHYNADSENARLVMAGKPVYTRHQELGMPLDENEHREGLRAIAVIPVHYEDRVIACVNIASHTLDEVPDFDRTAIETIATQIGNAIIRSKAEEALRESKANLSALLENTNDWICSLDSEYRILTMNKAFKNMFYLFVKIELEEGMNIMECILTKNRAFWADIHDRALKGEHILFEGRYGPEGFSVDVEVSVNPIIGGHGEITGASYFARDITERKRAEETLRESQELYRSLFEGVPVGLYRTMPGGEILDTNLALVEMVGYPDRESLLVVNLFDMFVNPEDRKRCNVLRERDEVVHDFEAQFRRYDNTVIWIRNTCRAVRHGDGQILYHEGAIQDITERKRAEEALLESEERYRTLFEESRDVIYITTREGKFIDINKSGLELFAYTKEEMIRLNVQDLYVDPNDWPKFQQEIERKGFVGDYEIKFRRKNGIVIDCLVTAIVQRANAGSILGYQGIIRDITERKQAEEQLRSSSEQLRALSAHLQSIREEERTLISREIHDELGQDLTGLKMDLSWLIKRLPKNQELDVKKVESMLKLVDTTIQSVRRISTKLRPGVLDDLGLTAAIEWQAQDFQTRTGIQCEFNPNLREIDLDRDRSTTVFRIFQETLTNVARHASATRVNICLNEEAAGLVLIVEDNGRGIKEREISDPKSLGLLGMRERALIFGGEVTISGAPGKGTTVMLRIPLQE